MSETLNAPPELPCPMAPLVPHARGMCLLDTLQQIDDDGAVAEVTPSGDALFADDAGIPAWVGVEWIAQTLAGWAGYRALASGEAPQPGLLLGCRRYRSETPAFAIGRGFRVSVRVDFVAANGVTQIEGEILDAESGDTLAAGTLTLYRSPLAAATDEPSLFPSSTGETV
ncbi:hypothetical protein [Salinicola aestuarinus]|uniref:ApeP family dehydratase n=1 Tax=Salinicola aestuarinus TaxID=1949082 RepID=UPI00165FDE10|nr:hypothetical protein [Salinicola aestuarinus]